MSDDYNQRHQQQQPERVKSSLDRDDAVMLDTDAGLSYKRDADDNAEEALLLHTSWMDWHHAVAQRDSGRSTLIGQYHLAYVDLWSVFLFNGEAKGHNWHVREKT